MNQPASLVPRVSIEVTYLHKETWQLHEVLQHRWTRPKLKYFLRRLKSSPVLDKSLPNLVWSPIPDPSLQQYKYAKRVRERRRRKGLGKWPTLSRCTGISFYTSVQLKVKRISVKCYQVLYNAVCLFLLHVHSTTIVECCIVSKVPGSVDMQYIIITNT